jgi:hypothetical protein
MWRATEERRLAGNLDFLFGAPWLDAEGSHVLVHTRNRWICSLGG